MTDRRNFLKQTGTLGAFGALSYSAQADERIAKKDVNNVAPPLPPTDIRSLTQHFNLLGSGIEPWMFVPKSNIAEISTEEHPGAVTVRQAGKDADIKGILRKPIGIGDFPLPWEFQMSLVQNPLAVLLGVGDNIAGEETRWQNLQVWANLPLAISQSANMMCTEPNLNSLPIFYRKLELLSVPALRQRRGQWGEPAFSPRPDRDRCERPHGSHRREGTACDPVVQ